MIDPLQAAQSIIPALKSTTLKSEELRRLDDHAVALIRESGLARLLTPIRYGGEEHALRSQILSCALIAHGCSAAAWVQMVCGAHSYVVGRFPDACQEEVFGSDRDVLIAGTLASQGTVERAEGGWVLNGRWQFCSGVDHSPWLLIGARQINDEQDPNRFRNAHVVVPTSDIEVDDTWHTLGMRGTGSKDIVAKQVFVPDYRAMPSGQLFLGTSPHSSGAVYRLPVLAGLASMLSATVLGMAESGVEGFIDKTKIRKDIYAGGSKAASAGIQRRVAEAKAELATARLLLASVCDRFDAAMAEDHPPMDIHLRAQLRWDSAYIVELSRRAFDRVFAASGAHAIYNQSELQRILRDIHTASHHAIVDFDGAAELSGRLTLGLDAGTPVV